MASVSPLREVDLQMKPRLFYDKKKRLIGGCAYLEACDVWKSANLSLCEATAPPPLYYKQKRPHFARDCQTFVIQISTVLCALELQNDLCLVLCINSEKTETIGTSPGLAEPLFNA